MPRSLALLCLLVVVLLSTAPGAVADEASTGGATAPAAAAAPSAAGGGAAYRRTARRRPGGKRPRRGRPAHRRPARRPPRPRREHRFPVAGPFTYGGPDARFGAERSNGRLHQGQDLTAAEGTPVVAPWDGEVKAVQYQASGAGHYVVLDGSGEERDYVFMHLRTGSIPVREGQTVRTGERIGEVGNTGRSSGAHLHFEIWGGRGWYSGGEPVDPLPLLKAWYRLL